MRPRVLVAGVGNIFLGDDGFGVRVAERLAEEPHPENVRIADFGIRSLHLAYELLDGYDVLILIDAIARRAEPGTVHVIEPEAEDTLDRLDAHGMNPGTVLALLNNLGGAVGKTFVVGCAPGDCCERIGLTAPVEAAVERAAAMTRDLVAELVNATA